MKDKIHLSIRMDREQHDKLQWIAEYDGRSMSCLLYTSLNVFLKRDKEG